MLKDIFVLATQTNRTTSDEYRICVDEGVISIEAV
jgi:hypothetical protein